MIQQIKQRLQGKDEGFTLIELMVVVLIIAILIAIAIPTFLGARGRAQDRASQSSLRNALTNAKAIYTDDETYLDANVANLTAAEPSLTFVDGATASDDSNEVSVANGVAPATVSRFVGAVQSKNNKCWYIQEVVAPGANAGTRWAVDEAPAAGTCRVGNAAMPAQGDADWVQNPSDAVDFA
jgi:type IV pilus assembly protein PilA